MTATTGFPVDPADAAAAPVALWLGPGELFRDLRAVLEVLAGALNGAGARTDDLDDLDRLLDPPPPSGRLLLEVESLPTEDVGLVRRFLRRYPGWSLVLCGGDPRHSTVRSLSLEGRVRWLAWPPDLDQLRALVGAEETHGRMPALAGRTSAPGVAPPSSAPAAAPPSSGEWLDVGELVEEFLASAALEDAPPHYSYSARGDLACDLPRGEVSAIVEAVLALASRTGGPGSPIEVLAAGEGGPPGPTRVALSVTFAEGRLAGVRQQRLLDPELVSRNLGEEVGQQLQAATGHLADLGGRADASRPSDGRVRVRVELPGA